MSGPADDEPASGAQPATRDAIRLLTPADIRALAAGLGLRPTKQRGQNFVVEPNTVRRIARTAAIRSDDVVLEVGPGLGSLTLALLATGARVVAVEIDPLLGGALPATVGARAPGRSADLRVLVQDALRLDHLPDPQPTRLVANLPYNVAVPVLLHLLDALPSLRGGLVMVQSEVAERLAAPPGSRTYGVPSAKIAWYADVERAGSVPRSVFWPVPNVDSGLVRLTRRRPPRTSATRQAVFEVVDAAFSQRRKTLRAALARWAGSPGLAEQVLIAAGVPPSARGEQLGIGQFATLAACRTALAGAAGTGGSGPAAVRRPPDGGGRL